MRVKMTIFGMIVVDCWKVYSRLVFEVDEEGIKITKERQKQFYGRLAAELIDNRDDLIIRWLQGFEAVGDAAMPCAIDMATGRPTSGVGARITPTKKKLMVPCPTIFVKIIVASVTAKQHLCVMSITKTHVLKEKFSCVPHVKLTDNKCVFTNI
jgi:hypothetical protein